jgi:NADP-dependent 3-hydroxy acid dehydrogenase YdfG
MHFNKVVWIAGASSGIGKELAIRLSQQGILILTSSNA